MERDNIATDAAADTGMPEEAAPLTSPLTSPVNSPTRAVPWRLMRELSLAELDGVAGIPRLTVQLLHNRGITGEAAVRGFLAGSWAAAAQGPAPLDLDLAAERIRLACARGERVTVYGDFDCDGVTSCALLTEALRALGAQVAPFVPTRDADGRGLNLAAVEALQRDGTRLIITTDCGTANVAEVTAVQEMGMDVIVTDHHPPLGEVATPLALVNPRRQDDPSASKDLAGVGVAFRLAERLLEQSEALAPAERMAALDRLLDLVAIGTIADMVPLTEENHALARAGLARLNTRPRPGLLALARLARLTSGSVSTRDISFALAPRLNAAGRLGDPQLAVELLLEQSEPAAKALAERLDRLNTARQQQMDAVTSEARQQVLAGLREDVGGMQPERDARGVPRVLFAIGVDWHLGVLGLVAGRLAEEFGRPVFVISQGEVESRGSARAPHGYDLGAALAAQESLFRRFGGHAQAAGFTLATDLVPTFRRHIEQHFEDIASAAPQRDVRSSPGLAPLEVDCRLPLRRLAPDIYADLEALEPFGPGFAEPLFLATDVRLLGCWRSGPAGRNLRLRLREGNATHVAVWSKQGDQLEQLRAMPPDQRLTIVYTLSQAGTGPHGEPAWLMRLLALDRA